MTEGQINEYREDIALHLNRELRNLHTVLLLTFTAIGLSFGAAKTGVAQSGVPQVVKLKNGAEFEGETFTVPTVGGLEQFATGIKRVAVVNDGMRTIFFAQKRIAQIGDSEVQNSPIPIWQKTYPGDSTGFGHVASVGPFDEHGHRVLTVQVKDAKGVRTINYIQGITEITPRHCELKTLLIPSAIPGEDRRMRNWTMRVGTNSIPVDVLRSVMRSQIRDYKNPAEHLQIAEFFLRSERYKQAIAEIVSISRMFPDLREEMENRRRIIRQSYARKVLQEIRLRLKSGQYDYALQFAEVFNKDGLAGEILAEFSDIQNQIKNREKLVEQTRSSIEQLISETISSNVLDEKQVEAARRFQNELETELTAGNLSRLDAYQGLANAPDIKADRKISLAISGWLVGSTYAIDNFAVVQSMYPVRDIAQEYLSTDDKARRRQLIEDLKNYEAGAPEFLSKIIASMKPPQEPDLANYTGEKPIEFEVEVPSPGMDKKMRKFKCLAHLPPQYDPYRKYPAIVTLRAGVKTETQLNRWCGSYNDKLQVRTGRAMRHGYVVISVDWKQEGQSAYTFSLREHAIVLKAYRQALRMFSIDTDRVFLHGHQIGATAAFDIGLSHPEHWAGIIGIGGAVDRFANNYSKNTHVGLPIYCVVGQKDKANRDLSKRAWDEWCVTDRYVDCVVVMYEGRGAASYAGGPTAETFIEEEPEILKWASAQRRIRPDSSGFSFACKSLRPWDNYFWFWKLNDIPENNVTRPEHWTRNKHNPITISGELKGNVPNRFILGPSNLGSGGTLSLSPEFVNFDERIHISGRGEFRGYVKPSSAIILEDVRKRADRQHPYWAKINCIRKGWEVAAEE